MKRKRLSAQGGTVTVRLFGLSAGNIVFLNDEGTEIYRQKVSGETFAFQMERASGLYKVQVLNDRERIVYSENFFVQRSTAGTFVNEKGEIVFSTSDFSKRAR
jgi:hypothetical protein